MAPRGKIGLTQAQTTALAEWSRNNAFVSELRVFGPAEQKGARERTATLTSQLRLKTLTTLISPRNGKRSYRNQPD
jgi:hypothetical protein